ncbi:MAG: ribulose-phosphate 3-epimerase [Candidatus Poribacteria bacterium]|nr:ribulose-phosphate 3-epimerase [Candidatus Poribacteria bacterium]
MPVESPASSKPHIQIAPSVMCADLCNLEADIRELEAAGVGMLHFDLMDAHFVPNMPIGLALIQQLRSKTDSAFDIHLMVENNDFFVDAVAEIGVQQIAVHVESATHLDRTLSVIQASNVKAGAALNPATPFSALDYVLDRLDFVLIMTVNPGFAGQKMVPATLRKIAECRAFLDKHGVDLPIEVDGNVSFENIPKMVSAGADILVGGTSSVFHKSGSRAENIQRTRQAIDLGLAKRFPKNYRGT